MTREEFKKYQPLYEMVLFEGKEYECVSVNDKELLGLDFGDYVYWVRCEDVTLIEK